MPKIVISLDAGYAGMDAYEFYIVPDDISDSELDDFCWSLAVDHAASYGIYPMSEYDELDSNLYEYDYSDNIEGSWELYCPEKHDHYRIGNEISWQEY